MIVLNQDLFALCYLKNWNLSIFFKMFCCCLWLQRYGTCHWKFFTLPCLIENRVKTCMGHFSFSSLPPMMTFHFLTLTISFFLCRRRHIVYTLWSCLSNWLLLLRIHSGHGIWLLPSCLVWNHSNSSIAFFRRCAGLTPSLWISELQIFMYIDLCFKKSTTVI